LEKCGAGVIADGDRGIRVAFSAVDEEDGRSSAGAGGRRAPVRTTRGPRLVSQDAAYDSLEPVVLGTRHRPELLGRPCLFGFVDVQYILSLWGRSGKSEDTFETVMPSDITRLTCGDPDPASELGQVLTHIGNMIDVIMAEVMSFSDRSDSHVTLYGPFLGRSMLEQTVTALIARFDPFRVLVIREMQRSPDYQAGVRLRSAIQWRGDVISEGKVANLWSPEKSMDGITRALLGDYFEHTIWKPAFAVLLDSPDPLPPGPWAQELQMRAPEGLVPWLRLDLASVYSSLSKGVHHEFVIPPEKLYDRQTVITYLHDAIRLSSHLGLLSHMVAHCSFVIPRQHALANYNSLQYLEVQ
jgi:hypothetical protein